MKKIALLLAFCMMGTAVFCGCGGNDNKESSVNESSASQSAESSDTAEENSAEADVTGTWGMIEIIDADGNSQTFEEYCAAQGVDPEQADSSYTLNEDGSAIVTVAGVDVEASYEFDGSILTVTANGASTPYTYNAENETLEYTDANTGSTSVMGKR
ncbi:MAG: hypothetical protein ACI4XI_08430 [Ruminococcus sp.]